MYDDIQDDYGYDAWDLEDEEFQLPTLPSRFCDYHPFWKKYKKTFLDLYFVAKRTKELIDFLREYVLKQHFPEIKELKTSYENVLKHLAVSKKSTL